MAFLEISCTADVPQQVSFLFIPFLIVFIIFPYVMTVIVKYDVTALVCEVACPKFKGPICLILGGLDSACNDVFSLFS